MSRRTEEDRIIARILWGAMWNDDPPRGEHVFLAALIGALIGALLIYANPF